MRIRYAAAFAALLPLLAAAGCDFFTASDNQTRVSPFIRDLSLSRSRVLCDQRFTLDFRYEDPQNDIAFMNILFQHTMEDSTVEVSESWEASEDLVIGQERASYTYAFACGSGKSQGDYTLQLDLEDERGHRSNTLTATIDLLSF